MPALRNTFQILPGLTKNEKLVLFELYVSGKSSVYCNVMGVEMAGQGMSCYTFEQTVKKLQRRGIKVDRNGPIFVFSNYEFME